MKAPRSDRRPLALTLALALAGAAVARGQQSPIPECGAVVVTSSRCDFLNHRRGYAAAALHRPVAHVMDVQSATVTRVPFAGNGLRQLLEATFAADPANSGRYLAPPDVTVAVTPAGGAAASATGSLVPDIGRSVAADRVRYRVRVEQGDRSFGRLPTGPCTLAIRADPRTCPAGQADFGAGCEPVCPNGQVDAGSGCATPAADTCPTGTCIARAACTYADTVCAVGSICPGATLISAACADRSALSESPCACSALQQLAAMSTTVSNLPPWNDLANTAYCNNFYLIVLCESVDNVLLPNDVTGYNQGLTGRMPVSVGDLGPVLTRLVIKGTGAISSLPTEIGTLTSLEGIDLSENALTSVPTEIGALTSLSYLYLVDNAITSVPSEIAALPSLSELRLSTNALTGVPPEFQTWGPSVRCELASNPGFSCANVGADTTCCSADNCGDVTSCFKIGFRGG